MDNLKLMGSFYAFMASSLYIFLKRFYLHQIVAFAFSSLFTLIDYTFLPGFSFISTMFVFDFFNYYADPPLARLIF